MNKVLNFFVVVSLLVITLNANAQIKVHPDSHVSICTLSDSWDVGVQIYPSGWAVFNTQSTSPWHIVTMATPGSLKGKCWIVTPPNNKDTHNFYVTGDGYVYKCGTYTVSDRNQQSGSEQIENAGTTIDNITGIWYTPTALENDKNTNDNPIRCAGVCAQEVEKVLPEAVTADENGMLLVNYETLTVFLIEAVKEQRKEIQKMQQILDKHGLNE